MYEEIPAFAQAVDRTTSDVLQGGGKDIPNLADATKIAVHYLLSELAFLEFAPAFLGGDQVVYVYHRNWPVYERYVSGVYDGKPKPYLDFLLLEHPTETYRHLGGSDQMTRISHEQTLRCAFTDYPPGLIEDPSTGEFSGIFFNLIQDFAKEKNWEVDWVEEVGYGVIHEGLNEGRYDIFTAPVWPTPERILAAHFTDPVYFSEVGMWVREENRDQATQPEFIRNTFVRVAIKEGDITHSIADSDFKDWRRVRVPQLTDTDELLRFVAEGDADVTFAEQYLVDEYNTASPMKLVNAAKKPIRTFPNCFMLSKQNKELCDLLNIYLKQQLDSGKIGGWIRSVS